MGFVCEQVFYALPLQDVGDILHEVWNCMHLTLALVPKDGPLLRMQGAPPIAESDDVKTMVAEWDHLLKAVLHRHIATLGVHCATLLPAAGPHKHPTCWLIANANNRNV